MKYVQIKGLGYVLFQCNIEHAEMVRLLGKSTPDVLSAGFVSLLGNALHAYDKSESLSVEAQRDDGQRMTKWMGTVG